MDGRIIDQGLRRGKKKEICDWLLDPTRFEIDWKHNRCPRSCDGRNVQCRYNPLYVSRTPEVPLGDFPEYCI